MNGPDDGRRAAAYARVAAALDAVAPPALALMVARAYGWAHWQVQELPVHRFAAAAAAVRDRAERGPW